MVRRIRRLVRASVEIVTDLLEIARDDGTDSRLELADADLGALVQEVVADHAGFAVEHDVAVRVSAPPTILRTDEARVRRILTNLVSNAIKYTPHGGRVAVNIVRGQYDGASEAIGIEIADNGPGIPAEFRDRVFDEFFRVSHSDVTAPGNGLGLAISRRLARLLGGDIVLREHEGGGCVFTLWLAPRPPRRGGRRATDRVSTAGAS
jgi:signal transduction histidine kinase